MKTAPLSDFCDFVQGGRHKLSGKHFVDKGYPAFGAGGMNGYLPTPEFERDGIVLSAIGARCGKCFLATGNWSSLANTQVIFPDESKADIRFLWYQLNDEGRWPRRGLAQPFIRPSDVRSHRVILPPLEEQLRIAAILDKAAALRRKRKRALELLEQLKEDIYSDLFVRKASQSWPIVSVGDVAESMRTGPFGSQLLHSEFTETGVPVLGIDNAVSNEFRWSERRFISREKYQKLKRYTVQPGDVLITIMGTCGRCAIVPDDIPTAINTKHLCCITLDKEKCLPEFLQATFLNHPTVRRQLGVQAKGAVMPGLNMGIIRSLQIQLPPVGLQEAFVERIRFVRDVMSEIARNAEKLETLFTSLQSRAFSGQL